MELFRLMRNVTRESSAMVVKDHPVAQIASSFVETEL
jgi:hypothetical protein